MATSITSSSITTTDLTVDSADNLLKVDHATNRVGIGTTTPDTVLHVNAVNPPSGIIAKFVSNGNPWIQQVGGSGSWQVAPTTNGYEFYNDTNSAYNLVISPTGNVGIGTRTPGEVLEVRDGTVLLASSTTSPSLQIQRNDGSGNVAQAGFNVFGSTSNIQPRLAIGVGAAGSSPSATVFIGENGNVGIGESNPVSLLNVVKTNNVIEAEIGSVNNGHKFTSQSDVGYDGFQIYQQHGSNVTRNSFSVQDNRSGSKSPAFAIRGDGRVTIGEVGPNANSALTIGGSFINSYSSTIYLDNNNTSGADGWLNTTDDSWTLKTNAGQGGLAIGTGTPQSSTARIHIGNDGTITMGKSVSGYVGTSGDSNSQLHVTGPITFGHGNISEWKKGGRRVLGWYSTSYHSSGSYTHIETDLYGGSGSNNDYIMGGFEIRGYRYANPGHSHEVIGFHNWSGGLAGYNVASMGNWTAGCIAYVGSNGYVYVRVPNSSYYGFIIDLYQYAWYPIRDIKVVATHENSTANM